MIVCYSKTHYGMSYQTIVYYSIVWYSIAEAFLGGHGVGVAATCGDVLDVAAYRARGHLVVVDGHGHDHEGVVAPGQLRGNAHPVRERVAAPDVPFIAWVVTRTRTPKS